MEAAKVLIDEHSFYAPSVHCSYYGCFQHIKSKLNQIGYTYEKIDSDISSSRQEGSLTLDSHNYPIKLILDKIEAKVGGSGRKEVGDKIKLLKTFRIESDYHNVDVNYSKSKAALEMSQDIIKLVNSHI